MLNFFQQCIQSLVHYCRKFVTHTVVFLTCLVFMYFLKLLMCWKIYITVSQVLSCIGLVTGRGILYVFYYWWYDLLYSYLSEIDLVAEQFQQLVGGVIWIIRDGKNHIQESLKIECQDTQETGKNYIYIYITNMGLYLVIYC